VSATVRIEVDGREMPARGGASVAAALLATGLPAGLFCGIGVCHGCTATVDGVPGVRTCVTTVAPGMRVRTGGDSS